MTITGSTGLFGDSKPPEALPMPRACIREMIADWIGASVTITGEDNSLDWYMKNSGKINLHRDTRAEVEKILRELYD